MRYKDGSEARLGDELQLPGNINGVVVASIDTDEYSIDYPKENWGYLKEGIMVVFDKIGLVHYVQPEKDLVVVKRA